MEPFFPSAIILPATTWLTLMTCFTLALNILHRPEGAIKPSHQARAWNQLTDQSPPGQLRKMADKWRRRHC